MRISRSRAVTLILLVVSANVALIWMIRSHKSRMSRGVLVTSIAFSEDSQRLACGSDDGRLKIIDMVTGKGFLDRKGSRAELTGLSFSRDEKLIAGSSGDGVLRVWALAADQPPRELKFTKSRLTCVAFSPDNECLATASADGLIYVVRRAGGQMVPSLLLKGHTGAVDSIAFNHDGQLLASASSDGTVRVWDVGTGKQLHIFRGHTGVLRSIAFVPRGRVMVSDSRGEVRAWDLRTGHLVARRQESATVPVRSLALHPNGDWLAISSDDGTVKIIDMNNNNKLGSAKGTVSSSYTRFSPNGQWLAAASDDRVWLGAPTSEGKIAETKIVNRVFSAN